MKFVRKVIVNAYLLCVEDVEAVSGLDRLSKEVAILDLCPSLRSIAHCIGKTTSLNLGSSFLRKVHFKIQI